MAIEAGNHADWSSWSDHCPLMVEISMVEISPLIEAAH
jgi:hypothetical protein